MSCYACGCPATGHVGFSQGDFGVMVEVCDRHRTPATWLPGALEDLRALLVMVGGHRRRSTSPTN